MTDTTAATTRHLGQVARGGAIGLAGAVASAASGFALVIVVTRGFPLAQAGMFFAATSAFLVLSTLSSLGTDTGLARFLLRYESEGRHSDVRRVLWAAVVPVLVLAFLLAAALWFAAGPVSTLIGLGRDGEQLMQALGLLLPFAVVSDVSLSAIRAFGRMGSTAVVDRLLRAGLQTVAATVVVVLNGGLLALVVSWGLAYVVSAIVSVVLLKVFLNRRLGGMLTDPSPVVREFWAFTWPRGLSKLSQIGIQKADIVIVAAVLNPTAAAVYTAATRFVALGQFATQALQQVLQPRFTAILIKDDRETLRQVYRISTAWNILLTWPIYLLIGCAPMAYLSIFGGRYSAADGAAEVVVVMTLAMLLAVASGPVDTLLLMAGRSRTSLINAVTALVIDLGLCVLLLPPLGIAGAGIAWAAAVLTRCALAYLQVRHQLGVVPLARPVFVAAGVGIAILALPMTAFSLVAPDPVGEWPGAVAVLSLCYVVVLWLFRRTLCLDLLAAAVLRPRVSAHKNADTSVVAAVASRPMTLRRLAQALKRRLPARAITQIRACALQWGKLTADLRMTPSFVIVGAQRSGTTTLFRLLEQHPDLVRPTLSKGTGYFDDGYDHGVRWYRAHFPLRWQPRRRSDSGVRKATFECSGYYLFHPLAAERIAHDLPDARVVVLVRDPVERAYSAYQHEFARGFESMTFEDAVCLETMRTFGESERLLADPSYTSFEHRHHAYLGRGEYYEQIGRLIDEVGRDRVYVMDADVFFAHPVAEFAKLQKWLRLREWTPDEVAQWNARPRARMSEKLRVDLARHFRAHDAALADLLGHEPSWLARQPLSAQRMPGVETSRRSGEQS